jgi:hypothetical protein
MEEGTSKVVMQKALSISQTSDFLSPVQVEQWQEGEPRQK